MGTQAIFTVVFILVTLIFAALNWEAFATPNDLNFLFAQISIPLGMVMLVLMVLFGGATVFLSGMISAKELVSDLHQSHELNKALDLAVDQEHNRIERLKEFVEEEFDTIKDRLDVVLKRTDDIALRDVIETETEELEERIDEVRDDIRDEIKSRG